MKLFDPRRGASVETDNPALILADAAHRSGYVLDWGTIGRLADYCDTGTPALTPRGMLTEGKP